jgi:calcineurin-like phosphoesterase family protein
MKNIFFTSDTHFNHENILSFKDANGNSVRDFSNVEEMNETIISRWNDRIKDGDKVYHLGDVFFGHISWMTVNWPRLRGSKRLIVGNHDNIKQIVLAKFFKEVYTWRKLSDLGLLLTHVPVSEHVLGESRFSGKKYINVHGHIHQNDAYNEHYINVCVEKSDYFPVHLDEILSAS